MWHLTRGRTLVPDTPSKKSLPIIPSYQTILTSLELAINITSILKAFDNPYLTGILSLYSSFIMMNKKIASPANEESNTMESDIVENGWFIFRCQNQTLENKVVLI